MKLWEKAAIGILLLAGTCSACTARTIPLTPRPDTRRIGRLVIDSVALTGTLAILQAALPNEAAVCYEGFLQDTLEEEERFLVLHLTSVTQAVSDSQSLYHVFFSGHPKSGCKHAIAVGHSHPYSHGHCDQSADDANMLFLDTRALASIAWCGDGELQVFYQDGRRDVRRWREP